MTTAAKSLLVAVSVVLALLLSACDNDAPDLSDVVVLVTPDANTDIELSSGEKVRFTLEISTINDYVANLSITSFDRQNGEKLLVDKDFDKKKFQYKFIYTAPQLDSEETDALLTFTVTDNLGNEASVSRTVVIRDKIVTLKEKTGIVLYAAEPGMPDALSFANATQTFNLAESPTPESADIYMTLDEELAELVWGSNTHTKFIRNNSFNYAEASAKSITSVYEGSTRQDNIRGIETNDIIIVGHEAAAQGVFLVTNVIRLSGCLICIQLNFKGIGLAAPDSEDDSDTEKDKTDEDKTEKHQSP